MLRSGSILKEYYIHLQEVVMYPAVIFPFGITVYLLCLVLQVVLGARKGYLGAALIIGLYLIGGLAFCLASRTLQDYYLTVILVVIQGIVFVGSLVITNYNKHVNR